MINENDSFEMYVNKISKYSNLISYYKLNEDNPNSVKIINILKNKIKEVEHFLLLTYEVNKVDSKLSCRYTDEEKLDYILNIPLKRDVSEEIHIIKILFNSEKFEKIDDFIREQPYNLAEFKEVIKKELPRKLTINQLNYIKKIYNNEEYTKILSNFYYGFVYSYFSSRRDSNYGQSLNTEFLDIISNIINELDILNNPINCNHESQEYADEYNKFISYYKLNKNLSNYNIETKLIKI